MNKFIVSAASAAIILGSVGFALAQGGGGGGGGGGTGDANAEGVSPNGPTPGFSGPRGLSIDGGRSVSNGGSNSVDVQQTQPPGSENQQR